MSLLGVGLEHILYIILCVYNLYFRYLHPVQIKAVTHCCARREMYEYKDHYSAYVIHNSVLCLYNLYVWYLSTTSSGYGSLLHVMNKHRTLSIFSTILSYLYELGIGTVQELCTKVIKTCVVIMAYNAPFEMIFKIGIFNTDVTSLGQQ